MSHQRINVNVRPSSGFLFKDTDGSMHRASNWELVIVKVTEYRARQGKNSETTAADVMSQACERYPSLCKPVNTRPVPAPVAPKVKTERRQPEASIKVHVLMWMARLFTAKQKGQHLDYVKPEEADARRGICVACPYNVLFIKPGCGTCKQITGDYRDGLIASRKRHAGLGGCLVLGVDLVTAVHLDEVRVDNSTLPSNCWRKISV